MPQVLENVALSSNQYTDAATAIFQIPTFKVALSVLNEPVEMQFLEVPPGQRVGAGTWKSPPEFTPPVIGSVNRPFLIGGVRFRTLSLSLTVVPVVSARPG